MPILKPNVHSCPWELRMFLFWGDGPTPFIPSGHLTALPVISDITCWVLRSLSLSELPGHLFQYLSASLHLPETREISFIQIQSWMRIEGGVTFWKKPSIQKRADMVFQLSTFWKTLQKTSILSLWESLRNRDALPVGLRFGHRSRCDLGALPPSNYPPVFSF